jgi:hypothetical protein
MEAPDQSVWNFVIGGGAAAGGALAGWFGKHRSHEDKQITQRDDLLKLVNDELVEPLRARVGDLETRLVKAEARNSGLTSYVYKLLAVLRRNHLETEIPEPPEGIQL